MIIVKLHACTLLFKAQMLLLEFKTITLLLTLNIIVLYDHTVVKIQDTHAIVKK